MGQGGLALLARTEAELRLKIARPRFLGKADDEAKQIIERGIDAHGGEALIMPLRGASWRSQGRFPLFKGLPNLAAAIWWQVQGEDLARIEMDFTVQFTNVHAVTLGRRQSFSVRLGDRPRPGGWEDRTMACGRACFRSTSRWPIATAWASATPRLLVAVRKGSTLVAAGVPDRHCRMAVWKGTTWVALDAGGGVAMLR
jgi:hypothetical protein